MAVEDDVPRARLVLAEMGLGKSGTALKFADRLLLRDFGQDAKLVRTGGRKTGAVYYFVPTIQLADEIAERARGFSRLRPFVLRGRGQRNPNSSTNSPGNMCAKGDVLVVQETARDDGSTAMCGPADDRCSAYLGCPWIGQTSELLLRETNLVILTHASLVSEPPGGDRLPEPVAVIVDEEPILNGGILAANRRFFGLTIGIGPSADDIDRVAGLVDRRVVRVLQNRETELQEKLEPWGSEAILASLELDRIRRRLSRAEVAPASLRRLAMWLRAKTANQLVSRANVDAWSGELHYVSSALKRAFRLVLSPQDWKRTPKLDADAEDAHLLRQVDDLFEQVIVPFIRDGPKDPDAPVPGVDVEIVQAKTSDGKTVRVPVLRFAWMAPLLKRWRNVPTLLLDGTGDPRIYERVWPELSVSPLIGAPWKGRAFWVTDRGFGKSALVKRCKAGGETEMDLTGRGELVRALAQFLARYSGGRSSIITHQVTEELISSGIGGLEANHHGAIRGLNAMRGVKAHLVVGRQMPPVKESERATEALFNRPVSRLAPEPGKTTADWVPEPVVCAGAVARVPRHPDRDVSRYVDQIATAGQAQAAHRARPLREAVDVFILGPELDWINGAATVVALEWDEIRPRTADRMLAERGVAFGGKHAKKFFLWLSRDGAAGVRDQIDEGSWLRDWAQEKGMREIRGLARPRGSRGGPATAFVALLQLDQELDSILGAVDLARVPERR